MTLKNVNKLAVISTLEDYIAWNTKRATDPFFKTRAEKGKQILAIVKNEPNNQGYHDDMVEAIYTIFKECERGVYSNNTSFTDAFSYIYHVLINEDKIERKINQNIPEIIGIYKTNPEEAMKKVLDVISVNKTIENSTKINSCKEILYFLIKLI